MLGAILMLGGAAGQAASSSVGAIIATRVVSGLGMVSFPSSKGSSRA
jgi:hypothetical protein